MRVIRIIPVIREWGWITIYSYDSSRSTRIKKLTTLGTLLKYSNNLKDPNNPHLKHHKDVENGLVKSAKEQFT